MPNPTDEALHSVLQSLKQQMGGKHSNSQLVAKLQKISTRYQRRYADVSKKAEHEKNLDDTFQKLKLGIPTPERTSLIPIARLALEGWKPGINSTKAVTAFRKARENIGIKVSLKNDNRGRGTKTENNYLLTYLSVLYYEQYSKIPPSGRDEANGCYVGHGFEFINACYAIITNRYLDPNTLGRYLADVKSRLSLIYKEEK